MTTEALEQATANPTEDAQLIETTGGLRIPLPPDCVWTQDWLIELGGVNPGWRFELSHENELIINFAAGADSADIGLEIGTDLMLWSRAGGGGRARDASAGYETTDAQGRRGMRMPDVSWVSPERFAAVSPTMRTRLWDICPSFVVEVRSRSDSLSSQQRKMELWLELGAQLGWLIDPRAFSVWIYRPNRDPERRHRPDTLSGEDILDGLVVDCTRIWQMADDLASL